jgi:hypothetical protein
MENEDSLIHLYQALPSQRDVIYNIFEKQYIGMLIKYSYRSEDNLQACKLALHLSLMTFPFKETPFILWLKGHCQREVARCLREQKGYDVYQYKIRNITPIIHSIDAPIPNGRLWESNTFEEYVGADTRPNIEEILLEREQIEVNKSIASTSPHYKMMLDFLTIPKPKYSHGKPMDHSVYDAFCDKYESVANLKKTTPFKNKRWTILLKLRKLIRDEINHFRKLNGLPPLGRKSLEPPVSKDHKRRWSEDWYQKNKEKQSEYYRKYNLLKKKKKKKKK